MPETINEKILRELRNKIEKLHPDHALEVIDTREPIGLYYVKEDGFYTGIDNSTGHAWTEDFDTKEDCFNWLIGASKEESNCLT